MAWMSANTSKKKSRRVVHFLLSTVCMCSIRSTTRELYPLRWRKRKSVRGQKKRVLAGTAQLAFPIQSPRLRDDAPLVVIPGDELHEGRGEGDARARVEDGRPRVVDEVGGHHRAEYSQGRKRQPSKRKKNETNLKFAPPLSLQKRTRWCTPGCPSWARPPTSASPCRSPRRRRAS